MPTSNNICSYILQIVEMIPQNYFRTSLQYYAVSYNNYRSGIMVCIFLEYVLNENYMIMSQSNV